MRKPASQGCKLADKGSYLNASDRRLQVQPRQEAKIVPLFSFFSGQFLRLQTLPAFRAISPIMAAFYRFPAATGTLRGLPSRKGFWRAAGDLPAGRRVSSFSILSRGSFVFAETAKSCGFCASGRPLQFCSRRATQFSNCQKRPVLSA